MEAKLLEQREEAEDAAKERQHSLESKLEALMNLFNDQECPRHSTIKE